MNTHSITFTNLIDGQEKEVLTLHIHPKGEIDLSFPSRNMKATVENLHKIAESWERAAGYLQDLTAAKNNKFTIQ